MSCYNDGDWYKYFKENMDAMNAPIPPTLFGTYNAAIATTTAMVSAIKTLGPRATMSLIIGAATGLEQLAVLGSVGASAYVGVVIGSMGIASQRSLMCGSYLIDLVSFANQNGFWFQGLDHILLDQQRILNSNVSLVAQNNPGIMAYA